MNISYHEYLHQSFGQFFHIDEVLYEYKTEHQHLIIFQNQFFGRVMALDGIIQTTERDEFIYHEMLVHVPLLSLEQPKKVLIIGGGDGASLREVLKHSCVEQVTQVEIDRSVIDLCKSYLPNHSQGAFDDPRADIVIADGFEYVSATGPEYDLIICDSTDPIGPGAVLFSAEFYQACRTRLGKNGILVTQNGVAFVQLQEAVDSYQRLLPLFQDVTFFSAAVPTYVGGIMAFGWACNDKNQREQDLITLQKRYAARDLSTQYYTAVIHKSAFALPQYLLDALS